MEPTPADESEPLLQRVGEVSLRMMANAIPRKTQDRVRSLMSDAAQDYPWQRIVDTVLADPVDAQDVLGRGLRAQRDWFARASVTATAKAGRAVRVAGKTALAYAIARLIFFTLYTAAVILVLVLAKHHWPQFDIYRILDWLRSVLPTVFHK